MLNVKPELVAKLKLILPTYYEYICNSSTPKPCITYAETSSADTIISRQLGYSRIQMTIKVWVDDGDIGTLQNYAEQVDSTMRELGYSRVSANELVVGNQIEKILLYEATGIEEYNL